MRYLRSLKGCAILDKIKNGGIRRETKVFNLCDKNYQYRINWKNLVQRMSHRGLTLPSTIVQKASKTVADSKNGG